ncbi:hypothetical protein [Lysinibacillus sp. SGAir0095]|uniref:hypothetical protein n=1 Tax=Lysinibacillus sp. SGAir0095 TaxID=2070463 RepID=UPI0010CCB314|nr:hypothetical protein [Lysinibacillus sp. SGAir0095]QCR31821.1 hypothetical protein C1N55_06360 [Lysinibacillus sp. SGAir0095]
MYGSILYNFWAGILGFSIYFFYTLSDTSIPYTNLVGSLIAAVASFMAMFAIRYLLKYVLYTPNDDLFDGFNKENERLREQLLSNKSNQTNPDASTSTMEFKDQSTEEIAKVVQTMMLQDESVKN